MEVSGLLSALFGEAPYFGGQSFGYQGDSRRHMFMSCAVQLAVPKDRPARLLEIGSWVGSSALTFAQAIRQFSPMGGSLMCVDPWGSYFDAKDVEKGTVYQGMNDMAKTDLAYHLFLHNVRTGAPGAKVDHLRGTSADLPSRFPNGHFDLIYIDGSHYYDDVLADLRICDGLLRDGGILCGDDLEVQVGEIERSATDGRTREDFVRDPKTGAQFHPGVTRAVYDFFGRRVSATIGFWAVRKNAGQYEDASLIGTTPMIPDHFTDPMKAWCSQLLGRNR
jgi:predicted O-methyltransferase YrrM